MIRLRKQRSSSSSCSSGSGSSSPPKCSSVSDTSLGSTTTTSCMDDSFSTISTTDDYENNECVVYDDSSLLKRVHNFLCFDALNLQSTSLRNTTLAELSSSISYISHYGLDVCFTEEYHLSVSELEPYRRVGDPELDDLLSKLSVGPFDDIILSAAAAATSEEPPKCETSKQLAQFYRHYELVPSWVDFDQIQRGIDVILAYLPAAGLVLYGSGLVKGFGIPEIVEVLRSTGHFSPRKALERLTDTAGLTAACFAPIDDDEQVVSAASLRPGGKGWLAALRVRVLHAKVRQRLLQLKRKGNDGHHTQRWDIKKNGVPINQEDMAYTLLAFSVDVLVGIEIIAGKPLPTNEQLDYLALWRYIGWLLGVDTLESEDVSSNSNRAAHESLPPIDPCRSMLHAYTSSESIALHVLHPEPNSCEIVTNLLSVTGLFAFSSEACRKLIGEPLADSLGLPKCSCQQGWRVDGVQGFAVNFLLKVVVYTFLMCFRVYTLLTMQYPWFRAKTVAWHGEFKQKYLQRFEKSTARRKGAAFKKDNPTSASMSRRSLCPFSMVMPPQM